MSFCENVHFFFRILKKFTDFVVRYICNDYRINTTIIYVLTTPKCLVHHRFTHWLLLPTPPEREAHVHKFEHVHEAGIPQCPVITNFAGYYQERSF